jgi:membrane protease YdiL (CAAX protease family)
VVLLAIGLVNQLAVKALLGHLPPSPWDSSAAMSATTKLVFLVFGAFGAPLTEELFFRGYLFGQFKGAGHVRLGIIVSAALFGAIHFSDAYNVPAICLFGVVLAWLFHRTGSLLAPIVAHAVNNAVSIAIMVL